MVMRRKGGWDWVKVVRFPNPHYEPNKCWGARSEKLSYLDHMINVVSTVVE